VNHRYRQRLTLTVSLSPRTDKAASRLGATGANFRSPGRTITPFPLFS
jgi:hypothetical protein